MAAGRDSNAAREASRPAQEVVTGDPLGSPPPPSYEPYETDETNERILRAVSAIYLGSTPSFASPIASPRTPSTPPPATPAALRPGVDGLKALCENAGLLCDWPRRKLMVLLVGNHSAGKSSFINWYVGENIQSTGVAIETQGFTFVTSGKRRETLRGPATLHLYDHLGGLEALGATPHLSTEVSTSRRRHFPLLTFIDTPGLVDGSFEYPFPIEACISELARHADLVLVFFDPNMQALCNRTLEVVRALNADAPEKLRFFLSKADSVRSDADRNKVLVQLAHNLTARLGLQLRELPTLYVPQRGGSMGGGEPSAHSSPGGRAGAVDLLSPSAPATPGGGGAAHFSTTPLAHSLPPNHIDELCAEFESAIRNTVQSTLDKLRRDASTLEHTLSVMLTEHATVSHANRRRSVRAFAYACASMLGPMLLLLYAALRLGWLADGLGRPGSIAHTLNSMLSAVDADEVALGCACALAVLAHVLCHVMVRRARKGMSAQLPGAAVSRVRATLEHVRTVINPQVEALYHDYFQQSVHYEFI